MTDIITSLVSSLHYWLGFTTALVWVLIGALVTGLILRWRDPNVSPNRKRRTRPRITDLLPCDDSDCPDCDAERSWTDRYLDAGGIDWLCGRQ